MLMPGSSFSRAEIWLDQGSDLVKRDFRNGNMVKCNSLRFYAIDFDMENF